MVNFCGVFACGKRADRVRDSHLSYYRVPTVRLTQGEQTRQLSEERQRAWLSNIGRRDIKTAQPCRKSLTLYKIPTRIHKNPYFVINLEKSNYYAQHMPFICFDCNANHPRNPTMLDIHRKLKASSSLGKKKGRRGIC